MSLIFNPNPEVPTEIDNAARSGELVVFIGAGVSRLVNCPSWDDLADKVLQQLAPNGIDYHALDQIKGIKDPKKRLSIAKIIAERTGFQIDYQLIFSVRLEPGNVYEHLNLFNSSFVTTNYDKYLRPVSRAQEPEENWRFFLPDQMQRLRLDGNGNVIHLHGCLDNPAKMVITTKEYLEHYSSDIVHSFLTYLFEQKTVLFLGYGLDEIEVLEYILRQGGVSARSGKQPFRRFILQGFFNAEIALYELLREYYRQSFDTELIGFPKDYRSYYQIVDIVAAWAETLKFGGRALIDDMRALEDEIRG